VRGLPWLNDNFANEMAIALLASAGIDAEKQQRAEKRMVEETLQRCGFRLEYRGATPLRPGDAVSEIVNAQGELLSLDEKNHLADVYREVKAEYLQRIKEAKEARVRAEAAERARRQAEYDASAAPYREERRRKKAAMLAKQQPKGKAP